MKKPRSCWNHTHTYIHRKRERFWRFTFEKFPVVVVVVVAFFMLCLHNLLKNCDDLSYDQNENKKSIFKHFYSFYRTNGTWPFSSMIVQIELSWVSKDVSVQDEGCQWNPNVIFQTVSFKETKYSNFDVWYVWYLYNGMK